MQKSRIFLSLALASGLLASTAMSNVAHAQRGLNFSGSSKWQVSEVSGAAAGGASYCTLSRSFDS